MDTQAIGQLLFGRGAQQRGAAECFKTYLDIFVNHMLRIEMDFISYLFLPRLHFRFDVEMKDPVIFHQNKGSF